MSAAGTALAEAYAADPGSVERFNGRMARIDAARKRERQRVEHVALGADRPEPELVRPDGLSRQQWKTEKARLRAAGSQLDDPELEARLQIKERWAHKKFGTPERSEEQTSELQSLMRISYAVFCLKKKILSHNLTPT